MEPHITDPRLLTTGQQVVACINSHMIEGEIYIDSEKAIFLLHDNPRHAGASSPDAYTSKRSYSWWIGFAWERNYTCCDYIIDRRLKKWNHQ